MRSHFNGLLGLIADGGFHDFLGIEALLARRCQIIIASDAGSQAGNDEFGSLAAAVKLARNDHGIQFLDLDNETPLDLERFRRKSKYAPRPENTVSMGAIRGNRLTDPMIDRQVPQQILAARIKYPEPGANQGLLFYLPMSLCGDEEIDLLRFQKQFPQFPDEHISDQFFTRSQVEAYRMLGNHIGTKLCRGIDKELNNNMSWERRFSKVKAALLKAYYFECWRESSYDAQDIAAATVFGELARQPDELNPENEKRKQAILNAIDTCQRGVKRHEKRNRNLDRMRRIFKAIPQQNFLNENENKKSLKKVRSTFARLAIECHQELRENPSLPLFKVGGRDALAQFCATLDQRWLSRWINGFETTEIFEIKNLFRAVFHSGSTAPAERLIDLLEDW